MVGGTVIEVVDLATKVYVNCADRPYNKTEECAIYVARDDNSQKIEIGDGIWWQGNKAMWTPAANRTNDRQAKKRKLKCGVDYDIVIPRIGYSGIELQNRPTGA